MSELSILRDRAIIKANLLEVPAIMRDTFATLAYWQQELANWQLNLETAVDNEQGSHILHCRQKIKNISEIVVLFEEDVRHYARMLNR